MNIYILHVGKIFIKSLWCPLPFKHPNAYSLITHIIINPAHEMPLECLPLLYPQNFHPNLGSYLSSWQM